MSGRISIDNLAASVRDWVEESLGFLLKSPLPPGSVRLTGYGGWVDPPSVPEVGLVVQFWGEGEGEIALLASRATAAAFVARFVPGTPPAAGSREEMRLVKGTLGEILNILSSKILSAFSQDRRHQRLTTPSCIFGRELFIVPENGETAAVGVVTPFGRLDFHLRLGP